MLFFSATRRWWVNYHSFHVKSVIHEIFHVISFNQSFSANISGKIFDMHSKSIWLIYEMCWFKLGSMYDWSFHNETLPSLNICNSYVTVMPDVLTVRVLAEPVLKYNTAVLRCQVPQSAASYTTIVSWTRGDAHLYPSPRGGKWW